ncbi:MAG: hypothetical protein KIS78_25535 [Labilithrix sp.]|nr:hypothetical protein [Labilithrix sp.]MCW5835788.1 hypothetical protein [Labilithrix sp.]
MSCHQPKPPEEPEPIRHVPHPVPSPSDPPSPNAPQPLDPPPSDDGSA